MSKHTKRRSALLHALGDRLEKLLPELPHDLAPYVAEAVCASPLPDGTAHHDISDADLLQKTKAFLTSLQAGYLSGEDLSALLRSEFPLPVLAPESLAAISSFLAQRVARPAEETQAAPPTPLEDPPVLPQGTSVALPHWLVALLEGSVFATWLKEKLQEPLSSLRAEKCQVALSQDVDFGIKRSATKPADGGLEQLLSGQEPHIPTYYRTVALHNRSPSPVVLVDIRATPSLPDHFRLHHDHSQKAGGGVLLAPGGLYSVTLELRCIPEEGRLLQQWLLFTLLPLAALNATPPTGDLPPPQLALVGRKVSALLAASPADVQFCLSTEAVPFYPHSLRTLFDTPPLQFHPGPPAPMRRHLAEQLLPPLPAHILQSTLSATPETPTPHPRLYHPPISEVPGGALPAPAPPFPALFLPPATFVPPGAYLHPGAWPTPLRNGTLGWGAPTLGRSGGVFHQTPAPPPPPAPTFNDHFPPLLVHSRMPPRDKGGGQLVMGGGCKCQARQLRQLARLLALEEAAMCRHIRLHDLFYATLTFHTPPKEGRPPLYALQVEGLPENQPAVVYGDTVCLRLARERGVEYGAVVWAVELRPTPRLLLALPPQLATLLQYTAPPWGDPQEVAGGKEMVHVRFTFDRLPLKRMHAALGRAAAMPSPLLPCMCPSPGTLGPRAGGFGGGSEAGGGGKAAQAASEAAARGVNPLLNEQQRLAVGSLVAATADPGPYVIFGPPGTGKTLTVVEACLQLLRGGGNARLCLCAPSNFAADILASGLGRGGVTPDQMWRLNDPRRTLSSVKVDVVRFCTVDTEVGLFGVDEKDPGRFRVIVCTCAAAGLLCEPPLAATQGHFSHILIDEAGQALAPETLIPLTLAGADTRILLCGDPQQLGPLVHSAVASEAGLSVSLLERYMRQQPGGGGAGTAAVVKLLHNYRAHPSLLHLPSKMFYQSELIASAQEAAVAPPREWAELRGGDFPMLFYGVKGQQMREGEAPSYFNPVEAARVVDLIVGLLDRTAITAEDVGCMAPYRNQVQKLRGLLRARGLSQVRVGTVDDYQGQEERVMFISTVLTRPESLARSRGGVGSSSSFLSSAKRFNVAITRAKALLVVVGHPVVLLEDASWRQLLRYCLARNAFRGAGSHLFPSPRRPPGGSPSAFVGEDSEEEDDEEDDEGGDDVAAAVERLAELSLLGMGDMDRIYSQGDSDELEWRVVL